MKTGTGTAVAVAETSEEMEARLMRVIARSQFDVLADDYIWQSMSPVQTPAREAFACVRDGMAWNQFVPAAALQTGGSFNRCRSGAAVRGCTE